MERVLEQRRQSSFYFFKTIGGDFLNFPRFLIGWTADHLLVNIALNGGKFKMSLPKSAFAPFIDVFVDFCVEKDQKGKGYDSQDN